MIARDALGPPRFIDDPFEDPHDGFGRQRSGQLRCRLSDLVENLGFPFGLIDRERRFMFQPADFHRARHSHVQQPYELVVDDVNPVAQLFDAHDFSQRTYSSTFESRSFDTPASATTLTRALPTTAASAHWPRQRTKV